MRKRWWLGILVLGLGLAVVGVLLWAQAQPQPASASAVDEACPVLLAPEQDRVDADARERLLDQLENKQGLTLTIPDIQALQPFELTLPTPAQAGTCGP